jgi:hypothetical protein
MAWDFSTYPEFQAQLEWIDAFVRDEDEGFEIGVQRRGSVWKIGIARFDSIEDAGVVQRTNATAACASL